MSTKLLRQLLWMVLPVSVAVTVWRWTDGHYPITSVQVVGEHSHVAPQELVSVIRPFLSGGFFSLDTKALQQTLLSCPWLERVDIQRLWPSQVRITLQEHPIAASWNHHEVISQQGVFIPVMPTPQEASLPQLEGPDPQKDLMWSTYQQLNALLIPAGYHIQQLSLTAWGSWSLVLNNGVKIVLGKNDIQFRLQRFLKALSSLGEKRREQIAHVDLRYTSGFSVGWQTKN